MIYWFLFLFIFQFSEENPVVKYKNLKSAVDAVIIKSDVSFELLKDRRVKKSFYLMQKIITDYAMDAYCDPIILFNGKKETVSKDKIVAKAYWENGTVVTSGDNAKNLSTPPLLAQFPHFQDIKEMIVTHTGVTLGGITELTYEILSKKGVKRKLFYGVEPLFDSREIIEKTVKIVVPADVKINLLFENSAPQVSFKEEAGKRIYVVKIKNRSGIVNKKGMLVPKLYFIEKDKDFFKEFIDPVLSVSEDNTFDLFKSFIPDYSVLSPQEKALKIIKFILTKLKTAHVNRDIFGWEVRNKKEIVNSFYADPFEKFVLIYKIAKKAFPEVKPFILLKGDAFWFHPSRIAGYAVGVKRNNGWVYFNTDDGSIRGGINSNLYMTQHGGKWVIEKNNFKNSALFKLTLDEELKFKVYFKVTSTDNAFIEGLSRFKLKEFCKKLMNTYLKDAKILKISALTITPNMLETVVSGKLKKKPTGSIIQFNGYFEKEILGQFPIETVDLDLPVSVNGNFTEKFEVVLKKSAKKHFYFNNDSMKVLFSGTKQTKKGGKGCGSVSKSVVEKNGYVSFLREFEFRDCTIFQDKWNEFKNFLNDSFNESYYQILVK